MNGGRVEPLGDAKFQVSFVPRLAAVHQIFVTFNDENIQGYRNSITMKMFKYTYMAMT